MQWESKYILVCTVHMYTHTHAQLYLWHKQNATHEEKKKEIKINATVGPETEFQQIDY